MNTEECKQLLLAKEKELSEALQTEGKLARDLDPDAAHETADESVDDALKGVEFTEANGQWKVLVQVRDALKRIEEGTFGKCRVDGRPIEEKRLKAIPWTPYCLKHEREIEQANPVATPTL